MKKVLVIISLIMLVALSSCKSSTTPAEDFSYEFNDGNVTITGYNGSSLQIVIPDTIEQRPVTEISSDAFKKYDMESIVIPNGVQKIGNSVFTHCKNLSSVSLPDSINYIGSYCFSNCDSLEKISIPNAVTVLYHDTFANCNALSLVDLPESLESINNYCFGSCTSLKKIEIPSTVSTLEAGAFMGCVNLEEVTMSQNLFENSKNNFSRTGFAVYGIFQDCPNVKINGQPLEITN